MRNRNLNPLKTLGFMVTLAVLGGCAQIVDSESGLLSGVVQLARVRFATIRIYKMKEDGKKGDLLAETVSDGDGEYKVSLGRHKGQVVVESTGGEYTDEATHEVKVAIPLTALIEAKQASNAPITPLSTLVHERVVALLAENKPVSEAKKTAKSEIAKLFGLKADDLDVNPTAPNVNALFKGGSRENRVALALAALSQVVKEKNKPLQEVIDVIKDEIKSDGKLDGSSANSVAMGLAGEAWLDAMKNAMNAAMAQMEFQSVAINTAEMASTIDTGVPTDENGNPLTGIKDGFFYVGGVNTGSSTGTVLFLDKQYYLGSLAQIENGEIEGYFYHDGIKAQGTVAGTTYNLGLLFSGIGNGTLGQSGKLYQSGSLFSRMGDGTIGLTGKIYSGGSLFSGIGDGAIGENNKVYSLGSLLSGAGTDGKIYSSGSLFSGIGDGTIGEMGKIYQTGLLFSGTGDGTMGATGKIYSGGSLFSGTSDGTLGETGKLYQAGSLYTGTGDGTVGNTNTYYTNGVATCIDENGELPFAAGSGIESDPYIICDPVGFNSAGTQYLNAHFKLTANIDFGGAGLTPIGSDSLSFSGVFDGNHYTLSNFVVSSAETRTGIFRSVGTAGIVKNLVISGADISGVDRVGLVSGYSKGKLENILVVDSSVVGTGDYVGGLVGLMEGDTTAILSQTYFKGDVSGVNHVGGLVGRVYFGKVQKSASEATVQGTANQVGGLVGSFFDNICNGSFPSAAVDFADNVSLATVSGVSYVGGVVGRAATSAPCAYRIISLANVTATGNRVGGFAGEIDNGALQAIISAATINASPSYRGAFTGLFSPMMYGSLYVDLYKSGLLYARGGSTSENGSNNGVTIKNNDGSDPNYFKVLTHAPYNQFDFVNIWEQVDSDSYPSLVWLNEALNALQ